MTIAGGCRQTHPMPAPGSVVVWTSKKYDGSPHRRAEARLLGSDEAGTWLLIPRGTLVDFAGTRRRHPFSMLTLLASAGPWHVSWLDGHDPTLYVDIAAHTTVTPDGVESVDLDLDVVRWTDGRVEVVDADEFAASAKTMNYPSDLVAEAPRIAHHVARMLSSYTPPFTSVPPDRWRPRKT